MDFKDIKMLFGGYARGDWFSIVDDFWSGKNTSRPFVLIAPWNGQPLAQMYPRSASPQRRSDHLPHSAHPAGHHPRCCVNKSGAIVRQQLPVRSDYLDRTFACGEPDPAVTAAM